MSVIKFSVFFLLILQGQAVLGAPPIVLAPGESKMIGAQQVVCSTAPQALSCSLGPSQVGRCRTTDAGCSVSCPAGTIPKCTPPGCYSGEYSYELERSSCTCVAPVPAGKR